MTISSILNTIKNDSKTKVKEKIIKDNSNNEILKNIFLYTLSPYFTFHVKNIELPKTYGSYTLDDNSSMVFELFDKLTNNEISGNKAREDIANLLRKFSKEDATIISNIIEKNLGIGVADKIVNRIWNNLIPEVKFQLANKYIPSMDVKDFFVSYKLDGMRVMFLKETNTFITRNQKEVFGFEHMIPECKMLIDKYNLKFLDGEVYSHEIDFQNIMSIVSKKKDIDSKTKKLLKYNLFAIEKESGFLDTNDMMNTLNKIKKEETLTYINILDQKVLGNRDINQLIKDAISKGYEGLMLRDPEMYYDYKRSDCLLKYKLWNDADLKIISVNEGDNKYKNMLGSLRVSGYVDNMYLECDVGTGYSDKQRLEFFKNKDELVGKLAEIKYFEITKNQNDTYYSLRFPVFMRIRDDK